MSHPTYPTLINAEKAHAADLAPLTFSGFAHFTAMQIRNRKVKGLDLHLARLETASISMFGKALAHDTVLQSLRKAVDEGPADMTLIATVYVPDSEFTKQRLDVAPAILIRTGAPSAGPAGPLRLAVVEHERYLPAIKHVGEGAKTYYLHRAVDAGFDDAAFVDGQGRLGEATIWNLAFWDGRSVVWPRADILTGTMMGIVQRQLERLGVPQQYRDISLSDLTGFEGAAVMNSWTPGVLVTAIGQTAIPASGPFLDLLGTAHRMEPEAMI